MLSCGQEVADQPDQEGDIHDGGQKGEVLQYELDWRVGRVLQEAQGFEGRRGVYCYKVEEGHNGESAIGPPVDRKVGGGARAFEGMVGGGEEEERQGGVGVAFVDVGKDGEEREREGRGWDWEAVAPADGQPCDERGQQREEYLTNGLVGKG